MMFCCWIGERKERRRTANLQKRLEDGNADENGLLDDRKDVVDGTLEVASKAQPFWTSGDLFLSFSFHR